MVVKADTVHSHVKKKSLEVTTVKNIVKHEQLTNILAYMTFAYVKHEKQETIKVKLEKKLY